MATKKYVIYYNEENNIINMCELPKNWKEGDTIMYNGIQCIAFAVFQGTEMNVILAKGAVKQIEDMKLDTDSALELVERVVFSYMN